jgi:large repetitive protein
LPVPLYDLNVMDNFPAGFKYVAGSARVDGVEVEPVVNGRQLTWQNLSVPVSGKRVIKLLLVVGAGVGEGEYVNTAQVINARTNEAFSGVASATVRVIPDPTFDCTDIIGKVFDDKNMNAYQDDGEEGIAGAQVATARGLRVTTDSHGRFHITCAVVPNEARGSNFIMKLDERSLPSGYRVTTENPRVQRATRGKMLKFNFGAAIHRVVRLDLADGVFEKGSTELRPQWQSRIDLLIIELQKDPSILRLSYLGENETEDEVEDRLDAIEELISDRWQQIDCCYKLLIEKEVFWRKGKPSDRQEFE